jgi:hypothetical protein
LVVFLYQVIAPPFLQAQQLEKQAQLQDSMPPKIPFKYLLALLFNFGKEREKEKKRGQVSS